MSNFVTCQKCNYDWIPRVQCPKHCPNCNAVNWWETKPDELDDESDEPKQGNKKFPIQDLEVGQQVLLPWRSDSKGYPDPVKNASMNRAVRQEESRKGKKFERIPQAAGLLVIRIS